MWSSSKGKPCMIHPPSWQDAEDILFDYAQQAIHVMATEHPSVPLSFFAYYAEPIQGYFEFHLDTPQNAIQGAMRREQEIVFFVTFHIQEKKIRDTLNYSHEEGIEALRIAYNASTSQWYLLNDPFWDNVKVSQISFPEKEHSLIHTALVRDRSYFTLFSSQFLAVSADIATLLYLNRMDECDGPDLIRSSIFVQEQRVQMESIGYADAFLVATEKETTVLLLLKSTSPDNYESPITRRFSLACYDKPLQTLLWEYTFEEGFPLASWLEAYDLMHFEATAMLVAGPVFAATEQATWIVGIAAMRPYPNGEQAAPMVKQVSHLVWIRSDGELLQRCLDSVSLRVHLCVSGTTVVGVDQINEQWRVWNWLPQTEPTLHTPLLLETGVQRAYVVAKEQEEGQGAMLWLIEQHPHEVRISCRFAETLEKVLPDVSIPHVTLLAQESYGGTLDWHMPVGLLPCGKTLIVSGVDSENHLALYQIG